MQSKEAGKFRASIPVDVQTIKGYLVILFDFLIYCIHYKRYKTFLFDTQRKYIIQRYWHENCQCEGIFVGDVNLLKTDDFCMHLTKPIQISN